MRRTPTCWPGHVDVAGIFRLCRRPDAVGLGPRRRRTVGTRLIQPLPVDSRGGAGRKAEATTTVAPSDLATAGTRQTIGRLHDESPGDVWPEPRSEWLARHFPLLSRLRNGNAAESAPDAVPGPGSDVVRVSSRSRPPAAVRPGPADDEVRPVDASGDEDVASRDSRIAVAGPSVMPPLVPTPLLVPSARFLARVVATSSSTSRISTGRQSQADQTM